MVYKFYNNEKEIDKIVKFKIRIQPFVFATGINLEAAQAFEKNMKKVC